MRVRWVASNGISRVLVSEGVVDRFVPIGTCRGGEPNCAVVPNLIVSKWRSLTKTDPLVSVQNL